MRQTGVTAAATSTAILAFVARREEAPLADIAQALGYTHQAVAKAVDILEQDGLMESRASDKDLRKRLVSLTRKGKREAELVGEVAERAAQAFEEVFSEIGVDLFNALRAFETALDRRPLEGRLLEAPHQSRTARAQRKRSRKPDPE
jgi:DNA-binding MarR family transcriptional regulator